MPWCRDSVVADHGIGRRQDPTAVGRVGRRLDISSHGGVERHLAGNYSFGAVLEARDHPVALPPYVSAISRLGEQPLLVATMRRLGLKFHFGEISWNFRE